jgi:hypothetical protein
MEPVLRRSGLLVALGLAVAALTLQWAHPLAFIAFLAVGALAVAAGAVGFLWSLARLRATVDDSLAPPPTSG